MIYTHTYATGSVEKSGKTRVLFIGFSSTAFLLVQHQLRCQLLSTSAIVAMCVYCVPVAKQMVIMGIVGLHVI